MSICPETYCYTASEAILLGYPVLAFSIGAHSERVEKYDCGWVLPLDQAKPSLEAFMNKIITEDGRMDILVKASHTKRFVNGEN